MEALHVEVDTTGAELTVVVARYKYSDRNAWRSLMVEHQHRKLEDHQLMDTEENLLKWVDLGALTPPRSHQPGSLACQTQCYRLSQTSAVSSDHQDDYSITSESLAGDTIIRPGCKRLTFPQSIELEKARAAAADTDEQQQKLKAHLPGPVEEESDMDWSDDGNAWCGCVCGQSHTSSCKFWLQCDRCGSWFDVKEQCVGFSESDAGELSNWTCWGCETESDTDKPTKGAMPMEEQVVTVETKPQAKTDATRVNAKLKTHGKDLNKLVQSRQPVTKSSPDSTVVDVEQKETQAPVIREPFKVGDLVFVEGHASPGVNTYSGVAYVTSIHGSDPETMTYDIKYVIGGSVKDVKAQYIKPHSF